MSSYLSLDNSESTPEICCDYKKLNSLAKNYYKSHHCNQPFPYSIVDDIFDPNLLAKVAGEASTSFKETEKYFYGSTGKHASARRKNWGACTRALLAELNSCEFLGFLEELTGIDGLICDPYFEGGGIHETRKGGFLKVHTDFNYHKKIKLDRRVNLLLYLNSDWPEEFGGHLELWDSSMESCQAKVLPIINRMVVFNTTDYSYHGHPEPLTCPDDRSRLSLALYYYTNGRPEGEVKFSQRVSTNYKERPSEKFDKNLKMPFLKKLKKKLRIK